MRRPLYRGTIPAYSVRDADGQYVCTAVSQEIADEIVERVNRHWLWDVWYAMLGSWVAVLTLIFLGAFGADGGAMPWQAFAIVVLGVGGLTFFLVTHVGIRKLQEGKPK